jgi:DNA-binding response OmpR family regulator
VSLNTQIDTAPIILIVEDDHSIGEVISTIIVQETSYQSCIVETGNDAWRLLQTFKPEAIILDYRLPDMTGLDLYDRLQTRSDLQSIPVVLTSASDHQDEIKQRDLLTLEKPFDIDDLLDAIRRCLFTPMQ